MIEATKIKLWKISKRYSAKDYEKYYPCQCNICGWSGLSKDCDGGGPMADTGDYNDPTCPKCHGDVSDISEHNLSDRSRFLFRKISFYVYRKNRHEEKLLNEYIKRNSIL